MARLSLSLLGPFQAALDGEPVAGFASNKVRALLAFLAIEQAQPHPRSTLAGLLWPDWPERSALANLRTALSHLRTAIADRDAAPPFLLITRERIQFNTASDHWIDVVAFSELAQADLSANDQLEEAIALYRGPFMDGFSVGDSAAYEDWISLNRERLQRQVLAAFQRLVEQYEGQRKYEQACETAWRWVELAPWHESAHRALMRLLALSGQRGAALAQYEACCRALREELDVEPEEETQRLYERIRNGDLGQAHVDRAKVPTDGTQPPLYERLRSGELTGAQGDPTKVSEPEPQPRQGEPVRDTTEPRPLSAEPPHNLSAELTPFVGRKALLSEVVARLQDPECRLLTLVGPGGSGKTRLARQSARALLSRGAGTPFEDGLFFASLAPLRSIEGIVPTIGSAIGFSTYEGGTPVQQLLDYLRQKRMLIILDNMEHLLPPSLSSRGGRRDRVSTPQGKRAPAPPDNGAASLVLELLQAAPGIKTLITSRTRLNVRGEHLLPIQGMRYPERLPEPTSELDQYSAVQLFLGSAREIRPGFEPTTDDLSHIVRICQLAEGMPLALLLASAWMEMLSPAEIARELESKAAQAIDFLATDWRDVPERHRSMRAVFDHSWSLLVEKEKEALQTLSIFRGGFTRQAAQAVAGASLRDIMTLTHKALLHRTPDGRYEIAHELLRQYAAEKLDASGKANAVRDDHSAYYAASLQRWNTNLDGAQQHVALAEMDVEIENARGAWDWAVEQMHIAQLDQSMDGLGYFYRLRRRHSEGQAAFEAASARLRTVASREGLCAWVRVLAWLRYFVLSAEVQRQLAEMCLEVLERPELVGWDTRREKAFVLRSFASVLGDGDRDLVRKRLEQSLALYRELGDHRREASALHTLGRLTFTLGAYDRANQFLEQSLVIWSALGNQREIARVLAGLGRSALRQGELEKAERLLRESSGIRQKLGDWLGVYGGLFSLGWTLLELGKYAEGHSLLTESRTIQQNLGLALPAEDLALRFVDLGLANLHLGNYEQARKQGEKGLAGFRQLGLHNEVGFSMLLLGQVALAIQAYDKAQCLLQRSIAAYQETGEQDRSSDVSSTLSIVMHGLSQPSHARECLYRALQIAIESQALRPCVYALPATALLLADRGEKERAVELYALASRHLIVANSRWFEDVAGKQIAAAAAALPPAVVSAAQERGRARDLDATLRELLTELESQLGSTALT